MKFHFFLLLAIAAALSNATAQEPAPSADHETDRAALRAIAARYEDAINKGDLTPLADSLLPEASAVFLTGDECRGLPAMQAFYTEVKKKLGDGSHYTVKLIPDKTDFYDDVAIGHGTSDEHVVLGSGATFDYQTKWTAVLKKVGDRWMASRLHVSLNPLDNPMVTARYRFEGWLKLGGGILLGAVLGFFLGKRNRKI